MAKARGTDGSLLASLPWTLAAIGAALLPHLPYLPIWITGAFLACAGWRIAVERRRSALPSVWLRALLALLCFLGVLATYETISGVGPGSALLAIMAALKLLETRRRRDQFVVLFIALFLVMSALLREQYLWSLPFLVTATLLIVTAWIRVSADRSETLRASFATGGRLMLYAAPLAVAMWVFFPRIATPFWSVPIDTGSAISGLSDRMSPGDISSLSLSDAVAFRVQFEGAIPAPSQRYWRGLVLHRFNGRSWFGSNPGIDPGATDRIDYLGNPVRYTVTLEPTRQQWIFALDMPRRWDLPRTHMGRQQTLGRVHPVDQRVAYSVLSFTEYRVDARLENLFRGWYTSLPPENQNPRTRALAVEMRDRAASDEDYIRDVLARFRAEDFYYTLRPPQLGANPVDAFLFRTRRGFCEHYASAFAVMMRAAGIPARVVLGYQGGEMNPVGEYMIVRQSDAHAWAEVWLEGRGWRRVDPTAAVAPERVEVGISGAMFDGVGESWGLSAPSRLLHRLTLGWDALNAGWNEFVLGYGPTNQDRFMRWLGMAEPDIRKMLLTMLGLVFGIAFAVSVLLSLRHRPPRRDRAATLYRRFIRASGLSLATGETPTAFAARAVATATLPADSIYGVTQTYLEARYGAPADSPALTDLERRVSAFRRSINARGSSGSGRRASAPRSGSG